MAPMVDKNLPLTLVGPKVYWEKERQSNMSQQQTMSQPSCGVLCQRQGSEMACIRGASRNLGQEVEVGWPLWGDPNIEDSMCEPMFKWNHSQVPSPEGKLYHLAFQISQMHRD